ncbi:MAG TPA: protein kinase [Candidatus Eisenbacteria bacterium]
MTPDVPDPDATRAFPTPSGPTSGPDKSSGPELPVVHAKTGEDLPETAASQLKAGQVLFNRYALKRVLGRGGFGVVWMADDRELEMEVALKFLADHIASSPDSVQDLKGEARRSLRLTHPNIVRIHNFIQEGTLVGISMEYVPGGSLPQIRAARGLRTFSLEEMRPLIGQLCDALEYAHTKPRIVHRDLKPANLMLDARGELKIADFGISRSISDSHTRLTSPGDTSGTLAYMSPQQMLGESPKPADDIYSLGATIFDLLTGKPPFHTGDIVRQALDMLPPRMTIRRREMGIEGEDIPEDWEQVVAACLAKDAADRPTSALAVAEHLGIRLPSGSSGSVRSATSASAAALAGETVVLGNSAPASARNSSTGPTAPVRGTTPTSPARGPGTTANEGAVAPGYPAARPTVGMPKWPLYAGGAALVLVVLALAVFRPWESGSAPVVTQRVEPPPPIEIQAPPPAPVADPNAGTATTPGTSDLPVIPTGRPPVDPPPESKPAKPKDPEPSRPAETRPEPPPARPEPTPAATETKPSPTPVKPPAVSGAETSSAEPAIRSLLHQYEQALEALDLGAYASLWVSLPEKSRSTLANSFRDMSSMSIDIANVQIEATGATAVARFKESRTITPKAGPKQSVNRDVRLELTSAGGGWKISRSGS